VGDAVGVALGREVGVALGVEVGPELGVEVGAELGVAVCEDVDVGVGDAVGFPRDGVVGACVPPLQAAIASTVAMIAAESAGRKRWRTQTSLSREAGGCPFLRAQITAP
jgi:hypothetical protein